jgi:hypothetical protein
MHMGSRSSFVCAAILPVQRSQFSMLYRDSNRLLRARIRGTPTWVDVAIGVGESPSAGLRTIALHRRHGPVERRPAAGDRDGCAPPLICTTLAASDVCRR